MALISIYPRRYASSPFLWIASSKKEEALPHEIWSIQAKCAILRSDILFCRRETFLNELCMDANALFHKFCLSYPLW